MNEALFQELCRVAGPVSRETFLRLREFEHQFRKWSQRIDLAAPSALETLWSRHILDSAQLVPLAPDALRWLDLGSGGGFPGAVLAVILCEREGARIELIESNRKKASFLQTTLTTLGVPVRVHAQRIEQVHVSVPEIITARALAPLPRLLDLSQPWLSQGVRALFHKGREYRAELEECHTAWRFDLVEHESAVSADGVILEITELRPR